MVIMPYAHEDMIMDEEQVQASRMGHGANLLGEWGRYE